MDLRLEDALSDIVSHLKQGRFPNEQAISQGIVLRILHELGWHQWDTTEVWPEFQTGEGRVDFALCHPPSKPTAFIEVKQPGGAEYAVRQALEYSFHTGVPFVVLTDGKTWSFYLPAEQGSYEERRVHMLDLFERDISDAADVLHQYLERSRVQSGEALEFARRQYRDRNRRAQARDAIPESWTELIEKGDELLVELLSDTVESKAGVRPDEDDVADFLSSLVPMGSPGYRQAPADVSSPPVNASKESRQRVNRSSGGKLAGTLTLFNTQIPCSNAKVAMVTVLRELADRDASFLQRCAQHPNAQGTKRRYIARSPEELYPHRPDLREHSESLPGGWFVSTNLNNVFKKNIIRLAADVAGLQFGKDITVWF